MGRCMLCHCIMKASNCYACIHTEIIEAFEQYAGIIVADSGGVRCAYANALPVCSSMDIIDMSIIISMVHVAATCSIKMAEPVGRTQPEPGALSCNNSSKFNPNMLLEVLRANLLKCLSASYHLLGAFEHNIKHHRKHVR